MPAPAAKNSIDPHTASKPTSSEDGSAVSSDQPELPLLGGGDPLVRLDVSTPLEDYKAKARRARAEDGGFGY